MIKRLNKSVRMCLLVLCVAGVSAAQSQQTRPPREDTQNWNEVQLILPFGEKVDLVLLGELRVGRNLSRPVDERAGIELAFKPNKYLTIAPSYRRIATQPVEGRSGRENRFTLTATVAVPFKGFTISDRNRVDRRLRSTGDTTQYRNRLRVEHPFTTGGTKFTAFVSDEVFYDSRERAWIRNRFAAGASREFSERFALEVYYLRQNDGFSRPGDLHVIGTSLRVRLRR